jgi:hypothetical protein
MQSPVQVSFELRTREDGRRQLCADIQNFPIFSGHFKEIREVCDVFKTALRNRRLRPKDVLALRRAFVSTIIHLSILVPAPSVSPIDAVAVSRQRMVEETALLIEYYTFECLVLYMNLWGRHGKVLAEGARFETVKIIESNPVFIAWTNNGRQQQEEAFFKQQKQVVLHFPIVKSHVDESAKMCGELWGAWRMDKFLSVIVEETPLLLDAHEC